MAVLLIRNSRSVNEFKKEIESWNNTDCISDYVGCSYPNLDFYSTVIMYIEWFWDFYLLGFLYHCLFTQI